MARGALWTAGKSVYDDLIRAGYPEGTARKIASGELPMDEVSRMSRKADQGYGDDLYHTTTADINEFIAGGPEGIDGQGAVYFTPDSTANMARHNVREGAAGSNVMPVTTRSDSPLYYDEFNYQEVRDRWGKQSEFPYVITEPEAQSLRNSGFDSVEIERDGVLNELATLDPSNVRSKYAAFDPDNVGKPNILGSLAAPTAAGALGAGLLASPEEAEAGFGGLLARNADEMMLNIAQKMKSEGLPRDEIWNKTGWGEGADGKWRFELDDSGSTFKQDPSLRGGDTQPMGSLSDVADIPEVFGAYPEIGDVRATNYGGRGGTYYPDDGFGSPRIEYSDRSSGLHETQHAIQDIEGFAVGGMPEDFTSATPVLPKERWESLMQKYGIDHASFDERPVDALSQGRRILEISGVTPEDMEEFVSIADETFDTGPSAFDQYRNLAGETEARNVQTRMDMTPAERRASPPWDTEDVPRDRQTVKMKGLAPVGAGLLAGGMLMSPEEAMAGMQDEGILGGIDTALGMAGDVAQFATAGGYALGEALQGEDATDAFIGAIEDPIYKPQTRTADAVTKLLGDTAGALMDYKPPLRDQTIGQELGQGMKWLSETGRPWLAENIGEYGTNLLEGTGLAAMGVLGNKRKPSADDLVRQGYPRSTAVKIASGELPMDEASRMARADEQGFLTDAYHASKQDISGELVPGYSDGLMFSTPKDEFANNWLGKGKMQSRVGAEDEVDTIRKAQRDLRNTFFDYDELDAIKDVDGKTSQEWHDAYDRMSAASREAAARDVPADKAYGAVYPLRIREGKSLDPATEEGFQAAKPYVEKSWFGEEMTPESERIIRQGNYLPFENEIVADGLRSEGYQSMRLAESSDGVQDTIASLYPSDVRSRFAAFDPDNTDKNNILGSADPRLLTAIAGGLGGGSALLGVLNEEDEDLMERILGALGSP